MRLKHFLSVFLTLLTLSVGQTWGITVSDISTSAATSLTNGGQYVIATAYNGTYLTTSVSSGWGGLTTSAGSAAIFTAHGSASGFYLTCSAGTLVPANSKTFNAYNSGESNNLSLSNDGYIQNSSSTGWKLRLNGTSGFRWYNTSTGSIAYLFAVSTSSPTLSVSNNATSLAMGDAKVNGDGVTNNTLSFSGSNLTANVSLAISGTNAGMFSVSPTSVNKGSGTITNQSFTVTYTPTAAGNHTATLTISSNGATSKTITLTGTGKYEVIWKCAESDDVTTLVASGSRPAFPSTPTSCDSGEGASTSFYGWSTGTWSGKAANLGDSKLSGKIIYTSAASMPTVSGNGTTYHAVFCKGGSQIGGITQAEITTAANADNGTSGQYSSRSYSSASGNWTGSFAYNTKNNNKVMQLNSTNTNTITSPTFGGNISKIEFTYTNESNSNRSFTLKNGNTTIGSISASSNTNAGTASANITGSYTSFVISATGALYIHSIRVTYGGAASNYMTTCCEPLAQINGSVSWSNGDATVSFADLADVTGWGLKYKKSSEENWSTYAGGFAAENGIRSNSTAISGLEAGSQYDFKVTGSYTGSTYCSGSFEAALSPNSSSYVPQMGNPSVSSITTLGYAYGASSSTAQSFTISASHLTGNLIVTAPDNFQVSKTGADANDFASTATLSSSDGAKTVWVRLATGLAENTYGGNSTYVTITGGGAAGKQVAVTGTVSPACLAPTFNSQTIADATYNLNAVATALSVDAKKNGTGPALTYQWLQCGTQDGTYVNAIGGSGATTSSYTPPTTTKGSNLYYKCEVSSGACSVYSNIAHIQVTTPTITVTESSPLAFGTKKVDGTYTATLHISGATLAKDAGIAFEVGGTNAGMFSVISPELSPIAATSGTVGSTDITVQYAPTAKGSHSATLTFSSTGATSVVINLTGTGRYEDTYKTAMHTGITAWSSYADGVTKSGDNYDVPNPGDIAVNDREGSNCQGLHYHFAGWVTDANKEAGTISGNIIAATGTKDASNTTYWAVWEKETTAGSKNSITITRSTTGLSGNGYNSGNEKTWTQSEIDFGGHYIATNVSNTPSGASASQYIVMKKNDGTLYNTEELPGAITEVEIQQYSATGCNIYCGDSRLMASNNTSAEQTPSGTLITKPDDATTMTWTIAASNNYKFFAVKAFTSSTTGTNYISSIKVTYTTVTYGDPKVVCNPCTATPNAGSVAVNDAGTFSTSQIDVKATGANAGTDCSYTDYGFVWSSSVSAAADLKLVEATGDAADNCTKVQVGTTGDATSFTGSLTGSFSAGNSIYVRSYVKNENAGVSYQYGSVVTITPCQVTFNMHGHGGNAPASQFVYSGGKVASVDNPSEQGWTFGGWFANDACTGVAWDFGTNTVSGNMILHAKWTEKPKYTITLNAGNGSVTADGWTESEGVWKKTQANGDAAITFPSAEAGCAGWNFVGWATAAANNADSDPTSKAAGDNLVPTSNVTYYAVYQQSTPGGNKYKKITTDGEFTTGYYVVTGLYSGTTPYQMKGELYNEGASLAEASASVSDNTITQETATFVWQIFNFGTCAVFKNKSTGKFLAIVDGKYALQDDAQKFTYSVSDGAWTFTAPSGKQIIYATRFNVGDAQNRAIHLYKQKASATGNYYTNPSCDDLAVAGVANPGAGGSVLVSAASAKVGEKVYAYYDIDEAYKFDNWSVSEGSSLSSTSAQLTEVTIGGSTDVTITANFTAKAVATVKFYNNGVQVGPDQEVVEGNAPVAPTLTDGHVDAGGNACDENSTTHYGWTKTTWSDTKDKATVDGMTGNNTVYVKSADLPEIAAGDDGETIEYHAVWMNYEAPANTYKKGTASDLTAGQTVLIVNGNSSVALKGASDDKGALSVIISENKITTTNTNVLWTVTPHNSGYYFKYGNNYLNSFYSTLYVDNSNSDDAWTLDGSGPYVLNSAKDSGSKLQYDGSVFTVGTGSGDAYNMDFYIPYISYADFRTTCCEKHTITNGEGDTDEGTWTAASITELCSGAELELLAEGKTGYEFAAWEITETEDETNDITDAVMKSGSSATDDYATIIMPEYGITVNATFAAKTYAVTFDKNGGTNAGSATATYMSDALTSVSHATREDNWNLAGYYTATTEGAQVIDANGNLVANVDGYTNKDGKWIRDNATTLYAQWIYAGTKRVTISPYTGGTITVSWNSGANSFTSGYQDIAEETVLTITAVPTTPGYTLTSLTVDGNVFTSGDTHTLTKDVAVTALFTPVTYSITYENMEGATNHEDNVALYTIVSEDVYLYEASKTGYHFDGWFKDNNIWKNEVIAIEHGSTGNVVVYAKWTANEYTVTLNKQGGTGGGSATITATFDSDMPTLSAKPGKSGYTFQGYYGETNGDGTQYYNADKTSAHVWDQATNEASIYAYWTPNQTTITLNNEGASTAGTTEVVATYDAAPTAINVPEKTDYVFGGYWTEASGSGSQLIDAEGNWIANVDGYTGAEKVWKLNAATLELHAFWKQSFTMTFAKGAADATGDAPSLDGTSAFTGDLVTLPANTYSRDADYYRFSEWAVEDVNGDPVAVTNGKFTMPASNVTITAQWWEVPELARTYTSNVTMTYVSYGANNETVRINNNNYTACKGGNSNNTGDVAITVPAGATALHFHAVAWKDKTATIDMTGVTNASKTSFELVADAGATNSGTYTLTGDPIGEHYFYFTFDQVNTATTITFTRSSGTDKRFIIYGANAIYPEIKLNPTEFDFNTVRANDTKSQVFEITTLNGVAGTLAASITDDAGSNYSVSSIVDGKVTVTFDPKGAESGTFTAKLRVAASNASVTADLTATAIPATQPEITVDRNAIDFGRIEPNDAASETIAVELAYIDEDGVTAALSGTDAAKFALSATKLTANGDLVISKSTTAIGIYSANLTLSATGATDVVIPLTMKVTNKWAETCSSNVTISASENDKKVKVGSSTTTYPAVKASAGGSATIQLPKGTQKLHFHVVAWNKESANVTISGSCFESSTIINVPANEEVSGTKDTYTFTEAEVLSYYHELDIENEIGTGGTTVTIQATSGKRFVLFGVNEEGGIHVLPAGETNASTLPSEINLLVEEGKTLNVNATTTLDNLTVEAGGKVTNTNNLTVNNLTIKSEAGKSGQVMDASKLNVTGELYLDVTLYSLADEIDADYWYSVAVPFDVDINSGIYRLDGTTATQLQNSADFDVWYYDTEYRASSQRTGWKRLSGKMEAGHAYLIGFDEGMSNKVRFKAADGWKTNLFTGDELPLTQASDGGDDTHSNWNGIANPTMHYIGSNTELQVFNNDAHTYSAFTNYNYVVGTAFFVKATSESFVIDAVDAEKPYFAPKRASEDKYEFSVRICKAEAERFDNQMYVRASEEASAAFDANRDITTMNSATAPSAMLWTENYGGKRLAIEDAPIVNNTATYTLGLYAPKAGQYRIEATDSYNNADLYLTYEGSIIWNLSMGEYTVDLKKGTTEGYGLLLQAKAPMSPTGIENIDALNGANVQKVILDEKVFILRGGKMYDVTGKAVK